MSIFPEYCILSSNGKLSVLNLDTQEKLPMRNDTAAGKHAIYYPMYGSVFYSDDRKQIAFIDDMSDGDERDQIIVIDVTESLKDLRVSRIVRALGDDLSGHFLSFQGDSFTLRPPSLHTSKFRKYNVNDDNILVKCSEDTDNLDNVEYVKELQDKFGEDNVKILKNNHPRKFLAKQLIDNVLKIYKFSSNESGELEWVEEFKLSTPCHRVRYFDILKNGRPIFLYQPVVGKNSNILVYYDSSLTMRNLTIDDGYCEIFTFNCFPTDVAAGMTAIDSATIDFLPRDLCKIIATYVFSNDV